MLVCGRCSDEKRDEMSNKMSVSCLPVWKIAHKPAQVVVAVEHLNQREVVGLAPQVADADAVQNEHDAQPAVREGEDRHEDVCSVGVRAGEGMVSEQEVFSMCG